VLATNADLQVRPLRAACLNRQLDQLPHASHVDGLERVLGKN
jgi:hypothetical protein